MFKSCFLGLAVGVLTSVGSAAFASIEPQVQTLSPGMGSGRATVRVPARSIYQYSPMITCDSQAFRMSHFSSYYEGGTLTVELRYTVRPPALGTSCTVLLAEDNLEEFDFGSGEALTVAPQSFRFVINR